VGQTTVAFYFITYTKVVVRSAERRPFVAQRSRRDKAELIVFPDTDRAINDRPLWVDVHCTTAIHITGFEIYLQMRFLTTRYC
jgi:hypothetical protein